MPEWSFERIRGALDPEWEIESVRVALEATGDGVRVTPPELLEAVADAEVYCGWGIRRDVFSAARKLRWFHSGAAGRGTRSSRRCGRATSSSRTRRACTRTRSRTTPWPASSISSAAWTSRCGRSASGSGVQSALNSPRSPLHAAPAAGEVAGASLGIIGYGGIGSALGRRAHALGMRVQAIRRTVGPTPPELTACTGPTICPNSWSPRTSSPSPHRRRRKRRACWALRSWPA